jgi:hypothetical protein
MSEDSAFRGAAVSLIREDSWGIYADGFKRAAELLISNVQSTYEITAYIRKEISDVSTDDLEHIEHLILQMHALDPTSEGSRYPVIRKRIQSGRNASFSWDSPHINLDELGDKMKTIGEFLHRVANFLSVAQDLEAEFRADYYSYSY